MRTLLEWSCGLLMLIVTWMLALLPALAFGWLFVKAFELLF